MTETACYQNAKSPRFASFGALRDAWRDLPAGNEAGAAAVAARQAELTKPPGSLGRLEDMVAWLARFGRGELLEQRTDLLAGQLLFAGSPDRTRRLFHFTADIRKLGADCLVAAPGGRSTASGATAAAWSAKSPSAWIGKRTGARLRRTTARRAAGRRRKWIVPGLGALARGRRKLRPGRQLDLRKACADQNARHRGGPNGAKGSHCPRTPAPEAPKHSPPSNTPIPTFRIGRLGGKEIARPAPDRKARGNGARRDLTPQLWRGGPGLG